jgi:hypothetical protein
MRKRTTYITFVLVVLTPDVSPTLAEVQAKLDASKVAGIYYEDFDKPIDLVYTGLTASVASEIGSEAIFNSLYGKYVRNWAWRNTAHQPIANCHLWYRHDGNVKWVPSVNHHNPKCWPQTERAFDSYHNGRYIDQAYLFERIYILTAKDLPPCRGTDWHVAWNAVCAQFEFDKLKCWKATHRKLKTIDLESSNDVAVEDAYGMAMVKLCRAWLELKSPQNHVEFTTLLNQVTDAIRDEADRTD